MNIVNRAEWDLFLKNYPDAHLLQTSEWGEFKSQFGWEPVRIISGNSGAQILFRRLPFGFTIAYIPKGPVGRYCEELFSKIEKICISRKAIVLFVEPDFWEEELDDSQLVASGLIAGKTTIQPRRTMVLSLDGNKNSWLEGMKQKTRYNIRLAEKKDIHVKKSTDIEIFNKLMKVTGERNVFGIHRDEYYRSVYSHFAAKNECELLIASYNELPLAAIMVFFKGRRAWYFYGASNNIERNRMPTYLLQFEAMHLAKEKGCKEYDLWGVPDFEETYLEEHFLDREDGLWGVYRFKRGFGGDIKRSAGAYQKIFRPTAFYLYQTAYRLRKTKFA